MLATRSPTLNRVTSLPTAITSPAPSVSGIPPVRSRPSYLRRRTLLILGMALRLAGIGFPVQNRALSQKNVSSSANAASFRRNVTADSGNVTEDSGRGPKIGHLQSESAVTFGRKGRSRSNGISGQIRPEYALWPFLRLSGLYSISTSNGYAYFFTVCDMSCAVPAGRSDCNSRTELRSSNTARSIHPMTKRHDLTGDDAIRLLCNAIQTIHHKSTVKGSRRSAAITANTCCRMRSSISPMAIRMMRVRA